MDKKIHITKWVGSDFLFRLCAAVDSKVDSTPWPYCQARGGDRPIAW